MKASPVCWMMVLVACLRFATVVPAAETVKPAPGAQGSPVAGGNRSLPGDALIELDLLFRLGCLILFGVVARLCGSYCGFPQRWPARWGDTR